MFLSHSHIRLPMFCVTADVLARSNVFAVSADRTEK